MEVICIIIILGICLYKYFKPSIDIIVIEDKKYKVLLWYNQNSKMQRNWIQLFII